MKRTVGKPHRTSGLSRIWPALLLACLVAEAAGFVVLHRSMQEYRSPASFSAPHGYR
jgi:hypothetical protein